MHSRRAVATGPEMAVLRRDSASRRLLEAPCVRGDGHRPAFGEVVSTARPCGACAKPVWAMRRIIRWTVVVVLPTSGDMTASNEIGGSRG